MATRREQHGKSPRRRIPGSETVRRRTSKKRQAARGIPLDRGATSERDGEAEERADGSAIRSDTATGFTPSPAQIKYLNALEEAVALRQSHSDTALCAKLGMSRMTVWKWRQCASFGTSLRARMDQTSDDNWPLILRRHELLAIQRSVRSAEFIAEVKSRAYGQGKGSEAGDGDPARNYAVQLLVHRPDDVASSTVLPLDDARVQAALMR